MELNLFKCKTYIELIIFIVVYLFFLKKSVIPDILSVITGVSNTAIFKHIRASNVKCQCLPWIVLIFHTVFLGQFLLHYHL